MTSRPTGGHPHRALDVQGRIHVAIKTVLATLDGVKTCRIGLEAHYKLMAARFEVEG